MRIFHVRLGKSSHLEENVVDTEVKRHETWAWTSIVKCMPTGMNEKERSDMDGRPCLERDTIKIQCI
jgi:hypothetical protein